MIAAVGLVAALWWSLAMAVLAASFLAALLHVPGPHASGDIGRPVTAIVPVKYATTHLEEDLASLFAQDYRPLEILITAAEDSSPAIDAARAVAARSTVPSQIVKSHGGRAASPKLDNLWEAIGAARHDLILTMDSNVRLRPDDLTHLVRHHEPGIGLVSTISITQDPQSFPAWIECAIVNAYHGRVLMLISALGLGVGCGKLMLFSKADLARAGGLEALAWAIGEDEAMQQAFEKIGLRTVLSDHTSAQLLGPRSWTDVWQRQLRWALIWRIQTPGVLVCDFLLSALPVSLAAALAAARVHIAPGLAAAETLIFWFVVECLLSLIKGWPLSIWSFPAFLGREILSLAVRLRALTTREVNWGGVRHVVAGEGAGQ